MKLKRKPSTYVTISNREVFSSAVGYFYGQQKDSTLLSNDTVKYWYYTQSMVEESKSMVESSWNVMAHGDAREGKWRGSWRMEWVASTLHTTSELVVSSITTADAHTSATSSRLNWRPRRFKCTRPFRRKTKSGFCACAVTFQTQSTVREPTDDNITRRMRCACRVSKTRIQGHSRKV